MHDNTKYISNITFVIFTFNEENRIDRVIRNFKDFGRILVADNKSTDKTVEIAQKYGCDILIREEHFDYVENQKMLDLIYKNIETDWIYWGFADEMLDLETLLEIKKVIDSGQFDIISIDRKNYYYGKFCYDAFSSRTNKIFKAGSIDFSDNKIHGFGKTTVPINKIFKLQDKYFVHHFISNTAKSYLKTIDSYTDTETRFSEKPNMNLFFPIVILCGLLIKQFILKKGYKAGFPALQLTLLFAVYYIIKNMKLYESTNDLCVENIEAINNKTRNNIIESTYYKK